MLIWEFNYKSHVWLHVSRRRQGKNIMYWIGLWVSCFTHSSGSKLVCDAEAICLYRCYTILQETMGSGAAQNWGWENERWWEPAYSSLTAFPGSQYCDRQHTVLLSSQFIMKSWVWFLMLITWNGQQVAFLCIGTRDLHCSISWHHSCPLVT